MSTKPSARVTATTENPVQPRLWNRRWDPRTGLRIHYTVVRTEKPRQGKSRSRPWDSDRRRIYCQTFLGIVLLFAPKPAVLVLGIAMLVENLLHSEGLDRIPVGRNLRKLP